MSSELSQKQMTNRSKYERIVSAEILSFIREGYRLVVRGRIDARTEYVRLHHQDNGNTIVCRLSSDGYSIRKNKTLLKEERE